MDTETMAYGRYRPESMSPTDEPSIRLPFAPSLLEHSWLSCFMRAGQYVVLGESPLTSSRSTHVLAEKWATWLDSIGFGFSFSLQAPGAYASTAVCGPAQAVRERVMPAANGARNRKAIRLIEEWLLDSTDYDERAWPLVKERLEESRTSDRGLFGG